MHFQRTFNFVGWQLCKDAQDLNCHTHRCRHGRNYLLLHNAHINCLVTINIKKASMNINFCHMEESNNAPLVVRNFMPDCCSVDFRKQGKMMCIWWEDSIMLLYNQCQPLMLWVYMIKLLSEWSKYIWRYSVLFSIPLLPLIVCPNVSQFME